jgi:hypothetical protein
MIQHKYNERKKKRQRTENLKKLKLKTREWREGDEKRRSTPSCATKMSVYGENKSP